MRKAKHSGGAEAKSNGRRLRSWSALLLLGPVSSALAVEIEEGKLPPPASQKIDFVRDISPILQSHCLKCHSDEKPRSHFHLTSREGALKGGEHGVDIIPGQSAKSPLIAYVARLDEEMAMPPEGKGTPLDAKEIGLLRSWIDQGLTWEPTLQEPEIQLGGAITVGGTAVKGDAKKFRELYWQRDGWNGGLEDFKMVQRTAPDSKVTVSGHVLPDDYNVSLTAEKNDVGFARFGWSRFRKYSDDHGGYYPLFAPSIFGLNSDLHMDDGRAWAELGLARPGLPKVVLGYEYQYRNGTESTLQWGPVSNGTAMRNIYPSFENISEKVHILKLDLDYEVAGVSLSDNFRGEWYHLETLQFNDSSFTLGNSTLAFTTGQDQERSFQGANTFHLEKQLTTWWFASGGYLYSHLGENGAVDVQTINPASLDMNLFAPGWNSQSIRLERESHVFSLSSLLGPCEGFSLSLGVQNEWTRQNGLATANTIIFQSLFPPYFVQQSPESIYSDLDRSIFTQDLGLRFTKIPLTTLFADARFQQDSVGQYEEEELGGLITPFLRDTNMRSDLKDFRVGFNTSPWRPVSFSAHYRRYDDTTDYPTPIKELVPSGSYFEGYPAFIRWRDLLSNETEAKVSAQLAVWLKTSLTYQWLDNDYRTETDAITNSAANVPGALTPGGRLLAGTYNSQLTSLNATLTPVRRLFISTTFTHQHARTLTATDGEPAVAPYLGDVYTALFNANYALNDNTDLAAGYSFSTADFAQDNFAGGLPLGIHYHQHGVQAGIKRRLGKGKSLGLQYRYYRYADSSISGASNFEAHALFATLAWRLP